MGTDLCLGSFISFCSQKRKWPESFSHGAAISFFPYFDFTLMNVYMNTGIE